MIPELNKSKQEAFGNTFGSNKHIEVSRLMSPPGKNNEKSSSFNQNNASSVSAKNKGKMTTSNYQSGMTYPLMDFN